MANKIGKPVQHNGSVLNLMQYPIAWCLDSREAVTSQQRCYINSRTNVQSLPDLSVA